MFSMYSNQHIVLFNLCSRENEGFFVSVARICFYQESIRISPHFYIVCNIIFIILIFSMCTKKLYKKIVGES
jgi:hypothetical protein